MAKNNSKLVTKVSPLIEGQVADFVQADHPVFVRFLKHYYQYLEAGRITYDGDLDYLRLQTNTLEFVLQEDGERIVTDHRWHFWCRSNDNNISCKPCTEYSTTFRIRKCRQHYLRLPRPDEGPVYERNPRNFGNRSF